MGEGRVVPPTPTPTHMHAQTHIHVQTHACTHASWLSKTGRLPIEKGSQFSSWREPQPWQGLGCPEFSSWSNPQPASWVLVCPRNGIHFPGCYCFS